MSQHVLREAGQISSSATAMFHAIGRLGVLPIVEILIRQCRELKTGWTRNVWQENKRRRRRRRKEKSGCRRKKVKTKESALPGLNRERAGKEAGNEEGKKERETKRTCFVFANLLKIFPTCGSRGY